MVVLDPFKISIAYEGVNYPAIVTPIDSDEVIVFEILLDSKYLRIYWVKNITNSMAPEYFTPEFDSFQGNVVIYNLVLNEILKVLKAQLPN